MTSLVKSLSLKNFKGFSDEVRIELRPITLLFGANSAGKSSVLHALQYAREILERNNANADRTLQGGEAVDLGGFLNLVHGRQPALDVDPDRHIEIEIEMALGSTSIPELVINAYAFQHGQTETVATELVAVVQQVDHAVAFKGVRVALHVFAAGAVFDCLRG